MNGFFLFDNPLTPVVRCSGMIFKKFPILGLLATLSASFLSAAPPARAEDIKASYETKAAYALHLLEAARYGEAADAAQALIAAYPDAALPLELRGTTALYVGSVGRASKDFEAASHLVPDPEVQYGLALCAMLERRPDAAAEALTRASKQALSPAQTEDVRTARAYLHLLADDSAGALVLLGVTTETDDALRAEVQAIAAYRVAARTDPKTGADGLRKWLETPKGVPLVRETEGIRALFEAEHPLEPSVVEPPLQTMYADRLAGNIADTAKERGEVRQCSGLTDLTAPESLPMQTAMISFSVDGQIAAMMNQPPYTFHWNTRRVPNGTHTVRMDAADAYGNALLSQTETVRVRNENGAVVQQAGDDPAMGAIKTRLWNLLRLRPSRKVAEWTVAQAASAAGDTAAANAHLSVAAALDPAYKDGRRFARSLFKSTPPVGIAVASAKPVLLWVGSPDRKQVALTFDDGPNAQKTPLLLDALDQAKAPATFFIVGSRAELVPDILTRMAARGDDVENHSYTHPNMNLLIPSVAESEILRTSVLIRAMTGRQPRFFRPPGGNADKSVQALAQSYGLGLAYWTVDAIHAEDVGSKSGLINYVLAHIHPGSIVLLHNGPEVTINAIPGLVTALRAKGYTLVTLSEIARGAATGKPVGTKPGVMPKMKE